MHCGPCVYMIYSFCIVLWPNYMLETLTVGVSFRVDSYESYWGSFDKRTKYINLIRLPLFKVWSITSSFVSQNFLMIWLNFASSKYRLGNIFWKSPRNGKGGLIPLNVGPIGSPTRPKWDVCSGNVVGGKVPTRLVWRDVNKLRLFEAIELIDNFQTE